MRQFRSLPRLGAPAALLAGMLAVAPHAAVGQPPAGGDKGGVLKGEVRAGVHRVKLEAGKLYTVRVVGDGFTPMVAVRPGGFSPLGGVPGQPGVPVGPGVPGRPGVPFGPGGPAGAAGTGNVFEGIVAPAETGEFTVVVVPNPDDGLAGRGFTYEATVAPLVAVLDRADQTTPADPPYRSGPVALGPHKEYPIRLRPGQTCVITLDRDPAGPGFDPFLALEGPGGEVVAQDDDGGGNLNARIVHQSRRGGEYRVIACGLGGGTGAYRVRVISAAPDSGGKAAPAPVGDTPRESK